MFKLGNTKISASSKAVSTGAGKVEDQAAANAAGGSLIDTLMGYFTEYKMWIIGAAAAFLAWKYLLPMLGIRKRRRGNAGSLAKARRAKAARRSKM